MTSRFVNLKRKQKRLRPAHLAVASLAALIAAGDQAGAGSGWSERSVELRSAGDPIMAIVALRKLTRLPPHHPGQSRIKRDEPAGAAILPAPADCAKRPDLSYRPARPAAT